MMTHEMVSAGKCHVLIPELSSAELASLITNFVEALVARAHFSIVRSASGTATEPFSLEGVVASFVLLAEDAGTSWRTARRCISTRIPVFAMTYSQSPFVHDYFKDPHQVFNMGLSRAVVPWPKLETQIVNFLSKLASGKPAPQPQTAEPGFSSLTAEPQSEFVTCAMYELEALHAIGSTHGLGVPLRRFCTEMFDRGLGQNASIALNRLRRRGFVKMGGSGSVQLTLAGQNYLDSQPRP